MNAFPSIPGWDGIHPALVHFPIALLLAAPLLLLVSLFARRAWAAWAWAAVVLMVLGTVAAWMAVGSGHAAGQLVDKTPVLERAIARHEELGMTTRNLFTALTAVFLVVMLLPAWLRKSLPVAARVGVHALFLVVFLGGTLVLARTANQGGRLVHELGVQAMIEKPSGSGAAAEQRADVVTPPVPPQEVKAD